MDKQYCQQEIRRFQEQIKNKEAAIRECSNEQQRGSMENELQGLRASLKEWEAALQKF